MKILINMLNNWEMTESESGYNALPFIAMFMFTQQRLKLFILQNLFFSSQSCLYDFICAMNCFQKQLQRSVILKFFHFSKENNEKKFLMKDY